MRQAISSPIFSRIAHDPGVNVPDIVLVKIGEGKRLQMVEGRVSKVAVNVHLHLSSVVDADIVIRDLDRQNDHIEQNERKDPLQCFPRHKVVQSVAVEQRVNRVDRGAQDTEQHHSDDDLFIRLRVGQDLGNPEPRKRNILVFFVIHFRIQSIFE